MMVHIAWAPTTYVTDPEGVGVPSSWLFGLAQLWLLQAWKNEPPDVLSDFQVK